MTIEARTAIYGASRVESRRDSNSSNGYQDCNTSDDDGYFTSAVSVQHKTGPQTMMTTVSSASESSTIEKTSYKKVVWPNLPKNQENVKVQESQHHRHHELSSNQETDHPMAWMKNVANEHHTQSTAEAMEMDIQKKVWDATTGRRLSRSRSKSQNIMERARSFERAAAEAAGTDSPHGSRAPSRQGSFSQGMQMPTRQRRRSPSVGRAMAEFWQSEANQQHSRPPSRAGRERSVGRVNTSQWEERAKVKDAAPPPKTPPQRRRELKAPSPAPPKEPEVIRPFSRGGLDHDSTPTPPPPPPPRAMKEDSVVKPIVSKEASPPPPPRPEEPILKTRRSGEELKSIQSLSPEEKEQIVEQWVEQTSSQEARDELEKFAYEIAETVVSTMEKHQQQQQQQNGVVTQRANNNAIQEQRTESTNEVHPRQRPVQVTTAEPQPAKTESHFGQVRTGQVSEKRNFWLRSASTEKLHEMSPGPKRRGNRIGGGSWIRHASEQQQRPGSSLGQAIKGEVKEAASTWSELSKSKSSGAILQEEKQQKKRMAQNRDSFTPTADEKHEVVKSVNLSEAHTNHVQETVTKWGHTPEPEEKRTITPSRHIGETFAEANQKAPPPKEQVVNGETPWRKKPVSEPSVSEQQPSLKVVNVAVENNNSANVHFSESAETLMANHMKTCSSSSMMSSSMASSTMASTSSSMMMSSSTSSSFTEQRTMGSMSRKEAENTVVSNSMTRKNVEAENTVVTQPPPKSPGPARKAKGKSPAAVLRPPPPPTTSPPSSTCSSGQVQLLTSSEFKSEIKSESHQQSSSVTVSSTAMPVISNWLAEEEKQQEPIMETLPKPIEETVAPTVSKMPMEHESSTEFLEARSKMLQEVASLRPADSTSSDTEDDCVTSQEKAADKAKQERNKELAEIAEMRCRANWQQLTSSGEAAKSSRMDPELEEARKVIRNTAAKWQERERVRYGTPPSGRNTPSRRIGNLFKKGSDHWSMENEEYEDFPAPPTDIEMEVTLPAPPPRDSSKDVMMEYSDSGKRSKNH